jgi:hypothetical protein
VVGSLDQGETLQRIVMAIADLPGVAAITLGGSTAAGLANELAGITTFRDWPPTIVRWLIDWMN